MVHTISSVVLHGCSAPGGPAVPYMIRNATSATVTRMKVTPVIA